MGKAEKDGVRPALECGAGEWLAVVIGQFEGAAGSSGGRLGASGPTEDGQHETQNDPAHSGIPLSGAYGRRTWRRSARYGIQLRQNLPFQTPVYPLRSVFLSNLGGAP